MLAVINNSRSEPDKLGPPADASRDNRTVEGRSTVSSSNKWIADLGRADEGGFPLSAKEVEKGAAPAEHRAVLPGSHPESSRKAIKTDQFATPSNRRKREEALQTPVTNGNRGDDVFGTSSTTRAEGGMWDGNEHFGLRSPLETPTLSRFRDSIEPIESRPERISQGYDVTEEVMELLKDQHIDEETSLNLRQLLNKHALKISGIAKGRDITRVALKAKDAKIAELQQKITTLETEREMDKTFIKQFKTDIVHSLSKRG
jgi:hypothetical protein